MDRFSDEQFHEERKLRREIKKMKCEAVVDEGEELKKNRKNRFNNLEKNLKRIQENATTQTSQSGINGSETAQETVVADNQVISVNRDTEKKATQTSQSGINGGKTAQEDVAENQVISENRVTEEKAIIQTSQSGCMMNSKIAQENVVDNQGISENRVTYRESPEYLIFKKWLDEETKKKIAEEITTGYRWRMEDNCGYILCEEMENNSNYGREESVSQSGINGKTPQEKVVADIKGKNRVTDDEKSSIINVVKDYRDWIAEDKKINQLLPNDIAIKITVKVINDAMSVDPKGGFGLGECFVGDATGNTILSALNNDQMNLMKKGKFLVLTHARTKMINGIMKLAVDPKEGLMEIPKKAPLFFNVFNQEKKFIARKVNQLLPLDEEINIIVKVLDVKIVEQRGYKLGKFAECLVGDETAMIVFVARNDHVDLLKKLKGKAVLLYNAHVNVYKGSMRLEVSHGNGRRIEVGKPVSFDVEKTNNMSLIEFERVYIRE